MKRPEAGGVEGNRIADVLGNFSWRVEMTLLGPAHRGAGYETTETTDDKGAQAYEHRFLRTLIKH